MNPNKWSVGLLHDPGEDDAEFGSVEEAIDHAVEIASTDEVSVYAVWDGKGTTVCIFTALQQWMPA